MGSWTPSKVIKPRRDFFWGLTSSDWPASLIRSSVRLSIQPSIINLSTYLSIYPSTHLLVYLSTHPPIRPSIHLSEDATGRCSRGTCQSVDMQGTSPCPHLHSRAGGKRIAAPRGAGPRWRDGQGRGPGGLGAGHLISAWRGGEGVSAQRRGRVCRGAVWGVPGACGAPLCRVFPVPVRHTQRSGHWARRQPPCQHAGGRFGQGCRRQPPTHREQALAPPPAANEEVGSSHRQGGREGHVGSARNGGGGF